MDGHGIARDGTRIGGVAMTGGIDRTFSRRFGRSRAAADRALHLVRMTASGFALCTLLAVDASPLLAQEVPSFRDKQIRLIVGSAPGGGYDAYGRLFATHMRRHIPGNPNI